MTDSTIPGCLASRAQETPDKIWLRDRQGDNYTEWSWSQARDEVNAAASWMENEFEPQTKCAILSRNRAHWVLADLAAISAGNVIIPLFTTLPADTTQYILEFAEVSVLFLGESENWENIRSIVPSHVKIITLPGVELDDAYAKWDDIIAAGKGKTPAYQCQHDDLVSLVFTSGTTGLPKGSMQTHDSMLIPTSRFDLAFQLRKDPQFLSYLPLSHIAERQLVEVQSILMNGQIDFNESLATLNRDLTTTKPNFFFGAPRVWEQFQQAVLTGIGSQEKLDAMLAADAKGTGQAVKAMLGLLETDYLLSAAAPISRALLEWYDTLGMEVMEGFGQTEAMGLIANRKGERKLGSIGRNMSEVEVRLSDEDELQVKATGLSPGYYKNPEKTAETFVDGWVHTGDKAKIDDEGYITLTGRVKDYFKTIQGKYVAPVPMEDHFSSSPHTEQLCLLGRGYSKPVMVCVLSEIAQAVEQTEVDDNLRKTAEAVNANVDKHARIGAVIVCCEAWGIDNGVLTPTLKIKRDKVEALFGEQASELATKSAQQRELLILRV
ncbi:MAG: AMP-binding protein [Pseudomonadales bacterium]